MSAHEPLPAALEEAVRECHRKGHGHAEDMLEALRAAWPAVRRELLAEVEAEPAAAERVEEEVRSVLCSCGAGAERPRGHHINCMLIALGTIEPHLVEKVSAALRRLHFGAVAGEGRARRALKSAEASATDGTTKVCAFGCGGIKQPEDHRPEFCPFAALAQPASEPAAALEALLGELRKTGPRHVYERLRKAVGWEEER